LGWWGVEARDRQTRDIHQTLRGSLAIWAASLDDRATAWTSADARIAINP
jgi:hypothetical protein